MTSSRCLPVRQPTILSFSGPDAVRFLNGQMTQDVDGLAHNAKDSCITNAKGRLEHFVSICEGSEKGSIWVISDESPVDELRDRLEKYLIADDVEVADLSGQWSVIHSDDRISGAHFTRSAAGPFGQGIDHWWPKGEEPTIDPVDSEAIEALRIEQARPAWGKDLEPGMLPPDAGLDRTAISYQKGCYIGQEVLSRMKTAGKTNRRLALLKVEHPVAAGEAVTLDGSEVGQLTSVSTKGELALGYLKKSAFDARSFATASGPASWVRWA